MAAKVLLSIELQNNFQIQPIMVVEKVLPASTIRIHALFFCILLAGHLGLAGARVDINEFCHRPRRRQTRNCWRQCLHTLKKSRRCAHILTSCIWIEISTPSSGRPPLGSGAPDCTTDCNNRLLHSWTDKPPYRITLGNTRLRWMLHHTHMIRAVATTPVGSGVEWLQRHGVFHAAHTHMFEEWLHLLQRKGWGDCRRSINECS